MKKKFTFFLLFLLAAFISLIVLNVYKQDLIISLGIPVAIALIGSILVFVEEKPKPVDAPPAPAAATPAAATPTKPKDKKTEETWATKLFNFILGIIIVIILILLIWKSIGWLHQFTGEVIDSIDKPHPKIYSGGFDGKADIATGSSIDLVLVPGETRNITKLEAGQKFYFSFDQPLSYRIKCASLNTEFDHINTHLAGQYWYANCDGILQVTSNKKTKITVLKYLP